MFSIVLLLFFLTLQEHSPPYELHKMRGKKIGKATTQGIALAGLCSFRLLKAEIFYGN